MLEESSFGDRGTRVAKLLVGLLTSRGGILRERPRTGKLGLLGVLGEMKAVSSLMVRAGSRNAGEGERVGFGASDNDLCFKGEDLGWDKAIVPGEPSRLWFEICSDKEPPCGGRPCGPGGTVVVEDMINPGEKESQSGVLTTWRVEEKNVRSFSFGSSAI